MNSHDKQKSLPKLMISPVAAGFPSPADEYSEDQLDLNRLLVKRPAATFFVRARGDSMRGRGIHDGDLLIVDRSLEPLNGSVVIAAVDGELTVKELKRRGENLWLVAADDNYQPLSVDKNSGLHLWGVVTCVIHTL